MKVKIERNKREVRLLVDQEGDDQVLASLNEMADADCWFVIDIRLTNRPSANPYSGSAMADDFCANLKPQSAAERSFYLKRIKESIELDDGTLLWCTYQNMWRGEQSVDGYTPPSKVKPHVYMAFLEGIEAMNQIRSFWESYEGPIAEARIDNKFRQPTESELRHEWWCHQRPEFSLPSP